MRTLSAVLGLTLVSGLAGCGPFGVSGVISSRLPAIEAATVPGPAYVEQDRTGYRSRLSVTIAGHERQIGHGYDPLWTNQGRLLVRTDSSKSTLRLLDPATGRVLAEEPATGEATVTPDAITVISKLSPTKVRVYDAGLTLLRTAHITPADVPTDQLGENAGLQMHGAAFTLDGVTWAEWAVNSEDDTKTDHGVLRIDGKQVDAVLDGEPIVTLAASRDGAALLAVLQTNGEEDCGGCITRQKIAEIDPRDGSIAADYGTPPGYDRFWRIEALDKIGDRVVVRYRVGGADGSDTPQVRHTWAYNGSWTEEKRALGVRVWWQGDGRLFWKDGGDLRDPSTDKPYQLTWVPDTGSPRTLHRLSDRCTRVSGARVSCPEIVAPGSLLPPG